MNADEVTRALGGRWHGSYGTARCPAHEDRSPSLSLRDGDDGRLLVHCFAGCAGREVLTALRGLGLLSGRDRLADQWRPRADPPVLVDADRITWALRIWGEARDPRGTVVEKYLNGRGLHLEDDFAGHLIRFHPGLRYEGGRTPGMVALFRDLRTDQPCGIHRTFLTRDGQKLGRKMLGRVGHAALKLDADDRLAVGLVGHAAIKVDAGGRVTVGIVVGEGLESCLAARHLGYRPVWAVGSASAIGALPVLDGIERLALLGENDASGTNARECERCARRWLATGQASVVRLEPLVGNDANDVLLGQVNRHG